MVAKKKVGPKDYVKFLVALPPELKRWIEEEAERDCRSRNMQIVSALEKQKRIVEREQEQA